MVFGRNFCEKRQIWVSEPHFREVGVTYDIVDGSLERP